MNYRVFVCLSLVKLDLIENVSSSCLLALDAVVGLQLKSLGVWEGVDGR